MHHMFPKTRIQATVSLKQATVSLKQASTRNFNNI